MSTFLRLAVIAALFSATALGPALARGGRGGGGVGGGGSISACTFYKKWCTDQNR